MELAGGIATVENVYVIFYADKGNTCYIRTTLRPGIHPAGIINKGRGIVISETHLYLRLWPV